MAAANAHELTTMSATTIAKNIRYREVSCVDAVAANLMRIHDVNGALNAVVRLCEDRALSEAKCADETLARGKPVGPLHGVPITIKDSFDTKGIISTGGTLGRAEYIPPSDAVAVHRLREAGAIVLGKTNTPELTIGPDTSNLIYGQTSNPYDLSRTPAGSSGGAAAILAAGGSALDIGSDTGGSLREPAHVCGIASLKPTAGRVPRVGHIVPPGMGAIDSLTQVGPMARYVEDLELALTVLCGPDWGDTSTVPVPFKSAEEVDLEQIRIAQFTRIDAFEPDPQIGDAVKGVGRALSGAGFSVSEDTPDAVGRAGELYAGLRNADGGQSLRKLLSRVGTDEPGPGIADRLKGLTPLDGAAFGQLLEDVDDLKRQMSQFMRRYHVLICPPAAMTPWRHDTAFPDPYRLWAFTTPFNLTGWPSAVVRAGTTTEGLPIGVQVVGRPWRDDLVLAVAAKVQVLLGGYQPPDL